VLLGLYLLALKVYKEYNGIFKCIQETKGTDMRRCQCMRDADQFQSE